MTKPEEWRRLAGWIADANAAGLPMLGQVLTRPTGILLGFEISQNPFVNRPSYQAIASLPFEQRIAILRQPDFRARLIAETGGSEGMARRVAKWDRIFPLGDPPDYEPPPDASVAAMAARQGRDPAEVAYDLLLERDGKAILYRPLSNYSYGNLDTVHDMLTHDATIVGLGDGGAHVGVLCDLKRDQLYAHALDARPHARCESEAAVGDPAADARFRLGDRAGRSWCGRAGYKADLNVIDYDRLQLRQPEVVYDLPSGGRRLVQRTDGYVATIVSGVPAVSRRRGDRRIAGPPGARHVNLTGPAPPPRPRRASRRAASAGTGAPLNSKAYRYRRPTGHQSTLNGNMHGGVGQFGFPSPLCRSSGNIAPIALATREGKQHGQSHQPRDRAAGTGPGDLLRRPAYRPCADPRAGPRGCRHLGRLHECRHGARRVRHGGPCRIHARHGRWRTDALRPSHADGHRRGAGERHRRGECALQRLAVPPDPRPRRAWHPAVPGGDRRRGAGVRRILPLSAPHGRRRSRDPVAAGADARRARARRAAATAALGIGTRGRGSEATAAPIWGLSQQDYMDRCDPWPLNPEGELLLG